MTITALKHIIVMKDISIHISTSLSPYPGDEGRHKNSISNKEEGKHQSRNSKPYL
jgi:hypothetical protein